MIRLARALLASALFIASAFGPAFGVAQTVTGSPTTSAVVVENCGQQPPAYTVGEMRPVTMDTAGRLCGSSNVSLTTGTARVTGTNIAATQWFLLVHLADTTNFPHHYTGQLDVLNSTIQIDRDNTTAGEVQMAVVTRVDATNGDATVFRSALFEKGSETNIWRAETYVPAEIRLGVVAGAPDDLVSSTKILNDTGLQTDVPLTSPLGVATVAPGVGDIVVRAVFTTGMSYNFNATVLYTSEPTP